MKEINVKVFTMGELNTNCYVIFRETDQSAVVIDPGAYSEDLLEFCRMFKVSYILVTHTHYDHVAGLNPIKSLTNAKIVVHSDEVRWLPEKPDVIISGDCELGWGEQIINVIHNPGHSPGGLSYVIGDFVFTGDTLMEGLIGPTDIPFSDRQQLITSIKDKLFVLNDELVVYPGHGNSTTIGFEKVNNPFPKIKDFRPIKLFLDVKNK